MGSFEVRLWSIRKRKGRSPFQLRWIVGDIPQAESFLTRALAESFRGDLLKAMRAGEEFDPITGRPMSWGKEVSWHAHCRDFAASRWLGSAGGSRKGRAAVMAAVIVVLVTGKRGCPDPVALRRALTAYIDGNTETNNARISAALDRALSGTEALVLTLWGTPVTCQNGPSHVRAERPVAA